MTREEAITNLNMISIAFVDPVTREQRKMINDTFDMAIKALSQEPCTDAVSRQAILDGIEELKKSPWATANRSHGYEYLITEALDVVKDLCVKQLPSVTQKSGKWIRWREEIQRGTHYTENVPHCKCSECDTEYDTYASRFINYCPNCGARMVEPQESEEISEHNMKMWEAIFKAESEDKE